MKTFKIQILLFFFLSFVITSCTHNRKTTQNDKIKIIFETDLGNDVDDILAMDMLYKYIENDKIDVLAIMINKDDEASASLVDILNTWYGHQLPIGIIRNGANCGNNPNNYAKAVCNMKDSTGKPLFARSLKNHNDLPDAHMLYRKILSAQPDSSVVIVSVGFSTNLSRFLDTPEDNISPLTGKELAATKVKLLTTMAGCINRPEVHEYNVVQDITAARKIFHEWPGKVVTSPFEVGIKILFPAHSIENDFSWTKNHPVVEAYKNYLPMPYDRPTWDLTAVLFAVEGDSMFTVSPAGYIAVDEAGSMSFTENPSGNRFYLMTDEQQDKTIADYFIKRITSAPEKYR